MPKSVADGLRSFLSTRYAWFSSSGGYQALSRQSFMAHDSGAAKSKAFLNLTKATNKIEQCREIKDIYIHALAPRSPDVIESLGLEDFRKCYILCYLGTKRQRRPSKVRTMWLEAVQALFDFE